MAIFNIINFEPHLTYLNRSRMLSGLLGQAIRFTAARFVGKGYPFDKRKLIYNLGKEAHPNVSPVPPAASETMKARQFFAANQLSGSRRCVAGVYQKDPQGNLTQPMRWVRIGKFKGFVWSYLKPLLGKSLDNVIEVNRVSNDELELVHGHKTGVVPLPDLKVPHMELMDRVEVINNGNTLRVHYREKLVPQPDGTFRHLGYHDIDISKYGLGKLLRRGKYQVYENPNDPKDPYTVKLFTKRYRVTKRVAGPSELREDQSLQPDQEVKHDGVIDKFESRFYLKVTLTSRSTIKIPNLNLPPDFKATVIRVRSSILLQHENSANGKNQGDREWIPFDKKVQRFPAQVPGVPDRATYLHFEGDPRFPYGTKIKEGKLATCVASQHFAPKDPRSESQIWPWQDQGGGFFGEIKKSDDGLDWLSYPYGQMEGREDPWFMPKGGHSLQAGKYLSWSAIFTGSNGMDRAPWVDRLFLTEELEFDAPFWSQLMHSVTITEDAEGAHEKAMVFDEQTYYDREAKSIASIIDNMNMGDRQRRRWGAMVGYFLSFAFKYLGDEIIRCRIFGALGKIPLIGRPFERARIPHVYTKEQIHEWVNTGTWFLDAIAKYILALTPALYIFGGLSPSRPPCSLFLPGCTRP